VKSNKDQYEMGVKKIWFSKYHLCYLLVTYK